MKNVVMRVLVLGLALAAIAAAQMGGMMGGLGMMGGSLGGMMGGSLSGMMGGGSGLTFGPDGTLYLTRTAATLVPTAQLAALDPNGNPLWTLPIGGTSASQPVLGKDGMLFLTTSDWMNWMYGWLYNRSTPAAGTAANLLVVKPGTNSASIIATVPLTGQVASQPQIATDNAGGYVVYVVTVDGFDGMGFSTSTTSGTYLYAFTPAGTVKYRLQLSQGGTGMMGF